MTFLPSHGFSLTPDVPVPREGARAVCLEDVTGLPPPANPATVPFTVLCATCIQGSWIWVTPGHLEKQSLGALLLGANVNVGQWYYLVSDKGPYEIKSWSEINGWM